MFMGVATLRYLNVEYGVSQLQQMKYKYKKVSRRLMV